MNEPQPARCAAGTAAPSSCLSDILSRKEFRGKLYCRGWVGEQERDAVLQGRRWIRVHKYVQTMSIYRIACLKINIYATQ